MIISDEHRFAFLHNPKCGGTTVRSQLRGVNSYSGIFDKRGSHPELGNIDYAHLPLSVVRQYFPGAFDKICEYESFVILRNPFERFLSSIRQRIRDFNDVPDFMVTDDLMTEEIDRVLDYLNSGGNPLNPEFVHFLRQSEFVFDEGSRIVKNVCTISDTSLLEDYVRAKIRPNFRMSREANVSKKIRNTKVEKVMFALEPAARFFLSSRARGGVSALMMTLGIMGKARLRDWHNFDATKFERVFEYYRIDIDLYEEWSATKSVAHA